MLPNSEKDISAAGLDLFSMIKKNKDDLVNLDVWPADGASWQYCHQLSTCSSGVQIIR